MRYSNKHLRGCADIAVAALDFYRRALSMDHGFLGVLCRIVLPSVFVSSGCKFSPSCSEYAQDAIRQYGLGRAIVVSTKRILRCHPWSEGGYDSIRPVDKTREIFQ